MMNTAAFSATQILLHLIGSVALLLWGVRLVRTGVTRALGPELRRLVSRSAGSALSAFFSGVAVTALLQSSTATALIVSSFAGRGVITLAAALALMLGADVGSTLAAQLLALDIRWLWTVAMTAGLVLFLSREAERSRGIARTLIGLALMLLSLDHIAMTAAALRESWTVRMLFNAIGSDPVIAFLAAAALTWAAHSSIAIVLFIMSLAAAGIVSPETSVAMVLGANLGGAVAPYAALSHEPAAVRRVPLGNLLMKGALALLALPFTGMAVKLLAGWAAQPGQLVVIAHTAFNLLVAAWFLPLTPLAARLLVRWSARDELKPDLGQPRHLEASVLDTPSEALACAMRETLHMGDHVEAMLRKALAAIEGNDIRLIRDVEELDNAVDRLHEAIKFYLVKASRAELSDLESRKFMEILTFTTNLEHIGDIIDKNLMELAAKKVRLQLSFSDEGLQDLRRFHARIAETMRLAFNVFATRDVALARRLFADKAPMRAAEKEATESHFARLKDGRPESLETSSIHIDIIRDLKRIHGHLTSVCYPILESEGELAESRLKDRTL